MNSGNVRLLPKIYVYFRGKKVRYGQQTKKGRGEYLLTRVSAHEVIFLINLRFRQQTFALFIAIVSILNGVFIFILPIFAPHILVLSVSGLLIALIVNRIETRGKTTTINYKLDNAAKMRLRDLYAALRKAAISERIYAIDTTTKTSDWKRQAGATSLIKRRAITIHKIKPRFLKVNFDVVGISHSRHTKLFFFPDRLVIYHARKYFSVKYSECEVLAVLTQFIEDETSASRCITA